MSMHRTTKVVLHPLIRGPSSGSSDSVHLCSINRVVLVRHSLTILTKESMHMNTYLKIFWIMPIIISCLTIYFKQRLKVLGIHTDNGKHYRLPHFTCTNNRRSRSSHSNPYRQTIMFWSWKNGLVNQRFSESP